MVFAISAQTVAYRSTHTSQCLHRQVTSRPCVGLGSSGFRASHFVCSHRQQLRLLAAQADEVSAVSQTEEVAEEAGEEEIDEDPERTELQMWAAEQLKALEEEVEHAAPPQYSLSFLWLDKNVAVAVDQVFSENSRSPMTEYFFWPRKDAWEELKTSLESRPWVSERDKVLLLNKTTEIINFWQDEEFWLQNNRKHSLQEAQEAFPDCKFLGC